MTLDKSATQTVAVSLNSLEEAGPVSLSEVEVGLTGMTESALSGVRYEAQPPRVNLQDSKSAESEILIRTTDNARPGNYTAMIRAFAPENDGLIVSKLYPIKTVLDVPEPATNQGGNGFQNPMSSEMSFQYALRIGAPLAAAGLIAFVIYRWKKAKRAY
jgi:hypothetical protein